ncbi:Ig-like domain-containing protein [Xanthobacter sp. KR7-225]|uniref:cadherin-like domain-containing protein n=1 Tax=Xanthobacter sp. KR7-225 TaxID=3156613 RepID=UPI0032B55526
MTDYLEGTEFRVNTTTTVHQMEASVASLADGGYVVAWRNYPTSGVAGDQSIYLQRYAPDGTPAGDEIAVDAVDELGAPRVAGLADGGYAVVWERRAHQGDSGFLEDIWIRRYAADGTPMGERAFVNTSVDGIQQDPAIAALADGGYMVTWTSNDEDTEGGGYGSAVWSQRYAADGTPVGGETLVNSTTSGSQQNSSVTGLADGGYVVAWESDATDNARDVYAQRYAADGSPVGGETPVNTVTTGFQFAPSVAGLADGGYVVTWTSGDFERDPYLDVYAQRYGADGAPVGDASRVNTTSHGYQAVSQVTALADGGYVVTWTDDSGNDGSASGIFAQRYHADGTRDGGETLVNSTTDGSQTTQAAAAFGAGYVVVWQSGTFLDSDADIYGKTWSADAPPPNAAPVAADDSYATNQGAALTITAPGLLANDTDADGDALTAELVSGPAHGTLVLNSDGSFTYTPEAGFSGADSFAYKANDGTALSPSTPVALTVTPLPNAAPVSSNDAYATNQGAALTITAPGLLANDTDADGDALTAELVSGPAHGTLVLNSDGSFTYTPEAGFSGADSFAYKANDGTALSPSTPVALTVTPLPNAAPVSSNDAYATNQGAALTITAPGLLANDTDADGDALTAELVSGPAHGTLVLNSDGSFTYTPEAGFSGADSFAYKANDGTALSPSTPVALTVTPLPNAAPVSSNDAYATNQGAALTITAPGLLANDTDADGDALTAELVSGPAHGSLVLNSDGSFTYTPEAGYSGSDGFIYKANDGVADSGSATATIIVAPPAPNLIEGTGLTDFLRGTAEADDIRGGAGRDRIFGGRGNDHLAGNAGNDLVFGGKGSDTIVFLPGDGRDFVFGFDVLPGASDKIALDARAFASYGDLTNSGAVSNGWLGAKITYEDGSQIILLGVDAQVLTADHFTFV